jgi:hypothetical protein
MYIVFGNKVVDSSEMKELIQSNSDFKVVKDMSKGSKREDILAYNLSISIEKLRNQMEENEEIRGAEEELTEDDLFDEYLTIAEEFATEIEDIVPKEAILDMRAYKWDKSDNDIKLVIAIAHKGIGERKLKDVMKILLRQVE